MSRSAASDLGLPCLGITLLEASSLKWLSMCAWTIDNIAIYGSVKDLVIYFMA